MLSESSQSEKLTQTSVIKWTGAPARATSAVESGGAAVTPAGAAAQPAGAAARPAGAAVTNVRGATLAQRRRRHTPTLRPGAAPLPDPALAGLCAVPDPAPPFDDDVPGDATLHPNATISSIATSSPAATLQSDTALSRDSDTALSRDSDTALSRAPNVRASTVASSAAGPTQDQPTGHASPRATWPSQFAQVLAETLAGSRPSRQLNPWTTERARGHIRRLGPLLAANREPRVRRIVACTPSSGVVEMAVVVCFGARVRALAVRLERDGITAASPAWRCTAIEAA